VKQQVQGRSRAELQADFTIANRLDGWFFRVDEIGPGGGYRAEGSDVYGRLVSFTGDDPDEVLERCVAAARRTDEAVRASQPT